MQTFGNMVEEIETYTQEVVEFKKQQPCNNRAIFGNAFEIYKKMEREMTNNKDTYDELKKSFCRIPSLPSNKLLIGVKSYSRNLKKLTRMLDATAFELDNISLITEFLCLITSVFSLLKNVDTISNQGISTSLTNQAYAISHFLGMASQLFWNCIPQSIYLRLVTHIGQRMVSWYILRKLLKTGNMCKESFEEMNTFFRETEGMNEEVKNIFFAEWDNQLVDELEKFLSESSAESSQKIFTLLYASALINAPHIIRKCEFLLKIFMFSTSTLGEEWYEKNKIQDLFPKAAIRTENVDLIDTAMLSKSTTFMDFSMLPETAINVIKSDSETELSDKLQMVTKSASPFIYGALDCLFVYFSFREILYGVSNKKTVLLRNLASSAKWRLEQINIFSLKYDKKS